MLGASAGLAGGAGAAAGRPAAAAGPGGPSGPSPSSAPGKVPASGPPPPPAPAPATGGGGKAAAGGAGRAAARARALRRGQAVPLEARRALGLEGLLPPAAPLAKGSLGFPAGLRGKAPGSLSGSAAGGGLGLEAEAERVFRAVQRAGSDLDRYQLLAGVLHERRDVFYACLEAHTEELLPIVYTPTVGEACQQFSTLAVRPRGLYVSLADRGRVAEVVANWEGEDVRLAVVTDGERILGLGDLGAGGMGIAAGKATVYTACGGVDPDWLLPICVDVGCDTPAVRDDPLYIGLRQPRASPEEEMELLDELVAAVRARFGRRTVIHWEDIGTRNAFQVLQRYQRAGVTTFNDDIQGTSAAVVAAVLGALRQPGVRPLDEQRVLFFGAGQANIGAADLLVRALVKGGLSEAEARRRIFLVDSKGLVTDDREDLNANKRRFAQIRPDGLSSGDGLQAAVAAVAPTALVGAASVPGAFDRKVVEELCRHSERPIVLALSNPLSKAECSAADAYEWSGGRVVFGSGTKFPAHTMSTDGSQRVPAQANNALVFPGLGLGAVAADSPAISDDMILAAAEAVASCVTREEARSGSILPAVGRFREVAVVVAEAVAELANRSDYPPEAADVEDSRGPDCPWEAGFRLKDCLRGLQFDPTELSNSDDYHM